MNDGSPGRVLARSKIHRLWGAILAAVVATCWGLAWILHVRGIADVPVLVMAPLLLVAVAAPLWRTWAGAMSLERDVLYWPGGRARREDIVAVRVAYTTRYRVFVASGVWLGSWAIPLKPDEVNPDRHVPLALWMDTGKEEFRVGLLRYPRRQVRSAIEELRAEQWPVTLELKGSSDA